MTAAQILGGWAAGAIVALIGLALVLKPANRDGWTIVGQMAAVWPMTLLVLGAFQLLFKEQADDVD